MSEGPKLVGLTIDGKPVVVPEGTLVIRAAEALGVEIPRFCEHPLLDPVGACRQCIVEVEGQKKPVTSCTTPVQDGMVVKTQHTSEMARKAQVGQLEFLLINHPLDCPVCDRGGECPLQDQALAHGPGESRYIDPKRVWKKPIPLSPLVLLDRERCVLCTRCTRFCDQISGERFIEMFDRGAGEQVSIAPGEDFRSPFSGNTVQICPVGALTSTPYRFASRPFDNRSGDSVCPHCACGCSLRVDLRSGKVIRHLARDNYEVNDSWLCDKGRYAYRFVDRDRLATPLLRDRGLRPASFGEVFRAIGQAAKGGRVAFLGGGRLTDEDAFSMSKLARTAFGTNDLDHRFLGSPDVPLEVEQAAAAGMPVTYRDVEGAAAILVVGLDTREELPILHLRVRKAWRKTGAKVFVIHPRRTAIADIAEHVLVPPGSEATVLERLLGSSGTDTDVGRIADALQEAGERAVVLAGLRLAESPGGVAAAAALAAQVGARFAYLPRRAGDRGALRAGVHPRLLPGGRRVDDPDERDEVEAMWGEVPAEPGRNARAILDASARREIDLLYLVGADPLSDFPDAGLVGRAMENVPFKVVQDIAAGGYAIYADAVLPAAAFLEKDGHFTDWEGRGQRVRPVRPPEGLARPDWEIFQELSEVLGKDMGFRSLDALHEEMGELLAPRPEAGRAEGPVALADEAVPQAAGGGRGASAARVEGPHALTLFTYPLLVDDGRQMADADELKRALGEEPFLEVHPADAERMAIEDGGRVRVKTEAGEAELPVRVSAGVARGTAFVPFNQPGFRANTLLSGAHTTDAVIEPVGVAEGAEVSA
ncbi:MAG TPA: NADH-quinone oxidoreductase subunit G [Actinomycetota bacterium]|nr:NADH-quinone oxidoreductase subunit G [Actinomycetota bacterium]